MHFEKFKRFFLQILIGCLVAAAGLAVVTILLGKFSDVLEKALLTLLIVAVHALISFAFIVSNEKRKSKENLEIFTNATFIIIVLSFITLIFAVWGLMGGVLVGKLFVTYLILLFAVLHGEVLAQTFDEQNYIDNLVYANYFFMLLVICMLLPVVFFASDVSFSAVYYRFLAAAGIIDATLTLLVVILHKLYLQKHPKVDNAVFSLVQVQPLQANGQPASPQLVRQAEPKRGTNILVIILIAFLALQFIGGIVVAVIGYIAH